MSKEEYWKLSILAKLNNHQNDGVVQVVGRQRNNFKSRVWPKAKWFCISKKPNSLSNAEGQKRNFFEFCQTEKKIIKFFLETYTETWLWLYSTLNPSLSNFWAPLRSVTQTWVHYSKNLIRWKELSENLDSLEHMSGPMKFWKNWLIITNCFLSTSSNNANYWLLSIPHNITIQFTS